MTRHLKYRSRSRGNWGQNDGKPGVVYILHNAAFKENWVKIGCTTRSTKVRTREINQESTTGIPMHHVCIFECKTVDCGRADKAVFARLAQHRAGQSRQEFFTCGVEHARATILAVCAEIDAKAMRAREEAERALAAEEAEHRREERLRRLAEQANLDRRTRVSQQAERERQRVAAPAQDLEGIDLSCPNCFIVLEAGVVKGCTAQRFRCKKCESVFMWERPKPVQATAEGTPQQDPTPVRSSPGPHDEMSSDRVSAAPHYRQHFDPNSDAQRGLAALLTSASPWMYPLCAAMAAALLYGLLTSESSTSAPRTAAAVTTPHAAPTSLSSPPKAVSATPPAEKVVAAPVAVAPTPAAPIPPPKVAGRSEPLARRPQAPVVSVSDGPQAVALQQPVVPVLESSRPIKLKDMAVAERYAKDSACNPSPMAIPTAQGPGFETYSIACSNGDVLMLRCEFSNCRANRVVQSPSALIASGEPSSSASMRTADGVAPDHTLAATPPVPAPRAQSGCRWTSPQDWTCK